MSKEAMKLALEALGQLWLFSDEAAAIANPAITALRDALAEQPAQSLPFGVGGGLVAIKTLLSRDPCVHANTAIQMIDAILAEQPAQRKPWGFHIQFNNGRDATFKGLDKLAECEAHQESGETITLLYIKENT